MRPWEVLGALAKPSPVGRALPGPSSGPRARVGDSATPAASLYLPSSCQGATETDFPQNVSKMHSSFLS